MTTPWMTWKQAPLLLLMIPIGFILGFHIAFLAMAVRKLTRIPYWIAMPILYAVLILPLWIYAKEHLVVLAIGTVVVILASLLPRLFDDSDGIANGGNLEHAAQAHILLIMLYLLMPAVDAATKAHRRIQEKQNNGLQTKASIERF
jgi:hypothetical protein